MARVSHPTFADLMGELRRSPVIAAKIKDEAQHVGGLCYEPGGLIVIDEAVCTAEVITHEVLHRMHPRWGERRVEREADYLMRRMSDEDVARLYRTYRRVRYQRSRPVILPPTEDAA